MNYEGIKTYMGYWIKLKVDGFLVCLSGGLFGHQSAKDGAAYDRLRHISYYHLLKFWKEARSFFFQHTNALLSCFRVVHLVNRFCGNHTKELISQN